MIQLFQLEYPHQSDSFYATLFFQMSILATPLVLKHENSNFRLPPHFLLPILIAFLLQSAEQNEAPGALIIFYR